jgi:hypothetical protein
VLESNSRRLLNPEHGEKYEGIEHSGDGNKCTGFILSENPQGVYLQGWLGGLVIMSKQPPNHPIHTVYSHEGITVILHFHLLHMGPIRWRRVSSPGRAFVERYYLALQHRIAIR